MTDIKQVVDEIAAKVRKGLGTLKADDLIGLGEGTHVVVPVEPTEEMDLAAAIALGVMLDGPRHRDALTAFGAIIKVAQND